ncbi:MAG: MerR family transcriptional regulator [Clostridia bacterium]|nr:MAG: MerR family transcriptional regulator [Clostridia bacterium]
MFIPGADQPLYPIGVVASLLGVHPETLRIWERNGLVKPSRRNGQRLYSNNDLQRLKYVHHLVKAKGLNMAGVKELVALYHCWHLDDCPGGGARNTDNSSSGRQCWKYEGTYCNTVADQADLCAQCGLCQHRQEEKRKGLA